MGHTSISTVMPVHAEFVLGAFVTLRSAGTLEPCDSSRVVQQQVSDAKGR